MLTSALSWSSDDVTHIIFLGRSRFLPVFTVASLSLSLSLFSLGLDVSTTDKNNDAGTESYWCRVLPSAIVLACVLLPCTLVLLLLLFVVLLLLDLIEQAHALHGVVWGGCQVVQRGHLLGSEAPRDAQRLDILLQILWFDGRGCESGQQASTQFVSNRANNPNNGGVARKYGVHARLTGIRGTLPSAGIPVQPIACVNRGFNSSTGQDRAGHCKTGESMRQCQRNAATQTWPTVALCAAAMALTSGAPKSAA